MKFTNSYKFARLQIHTLMHTHPAGSSYFRILDYSNLNTTYNGTAYGDQTTHNVARRMNEYANTVAAFRTGGDEQTLAASISGTSYISSSGCYTFTGNTSCTNISSYSWSVSSDGYTYTNISSSSTANVCVYPGSSYVTRGQIYLKLLVTSSDGQAVYAYWYVGVNTSIHSLAKNNSTNVFNKAEAIVLSEAYPNPAGNEVTISFSIPQKQNVRLELFDQLGMRVRVIESGELESSEYSRTFTIENFVSGIYFYKLTADNFSQTKKLLVIK